MAHRFPRKPNCDYLVSDPQKDRFKDNEGACHKKKGGGLPRSKGTPSTPVEGRSSSAPASHAAQQWVGPATNSEHSVIEELSVQDTVPQQSGVRPRKGEHGGKVSANRSVHGHGKRNAVGSVSTVASQTPTPGPGKGRGQLSGLRSHSVNQLRQTSSSATETRHRPGQPEQLSGDLGSHGQYPGRRPASRGKAQRQVSSPKIVTRNHSETFLPEQHLVQEKRKLKNKCPAGKVETVRSSQILSASKEKKQEGDSPEQSVHLNHSDGSQVLTSTKRGKRLKRKRGRQSVGSSEQSSALSHSSLSQYSSQVQLPPKRACLSDNQPAGVEAELRPLGKKSFLRRAQQDMLISSAAYPERDSGETADSGLKTGLAGVHDVGRPCTRHSLHNISSTRLRNYRYLGSAKKQSRGRHQCFQDSDAVSDISSQNTGSPVVPQKVTRGRKRGRAVNPGSVKFTDESLTPGNGLSLTEKKARWTETRRTVLATDRGVLSSEGGARPLRKVLGHTHSHTLFARKVERTETTQSAVTEIVCVATRSRSLTSKQGCGVKREQPLRDGSLDRPRRSLLKRKTCECVDEISEASFSDSDTGYQRKATNNSKDEDRAWRSRKRSGRLKLKGGSGKSSGRQCKNKLQSDNKSWLHHHQQTQEITNVYPVHLHPAAPLKQEVPVPSVLHCAKKEDVKLEDTQQLYSNSVVKVETAGEVESLQRPEVPTSKWTPAPYTCIQGAEQVVYMGEDFYVVVADSEDEDSAEVITRDVSLEDHTQVAESVKTEEREETDILAEDITQVPVSDTTEQREETDMSAQDHTQVPVGDMTGQREEIDMSGGDCTQVPVSDITGQRKEIDMSEDCSQVPVSDTTGQRKEIDMSEDCLQVPVSNTTGQREEIDMSEDCSQVPESDMTGQRQETNMLAEDCTQVLESIITEENKKTDMSEGDYTQVPESDMTGQSEETDTLVKDCSQVLESVITEENKETDMSEDHTQVPVSDTTGQREENDMSVGDCTQVLERVTTEQREETDMSVGDYTQVLESDMTEQKEETDMSAQDHTQVPLSDTTGQRQESEMSVGDHTQVLESATTEQKEETDMSVGDHTQVPESDTVGQRQETDMLAEDCSQVLERVTTEQKEETDMSIGDHTQVPESVTFEQKEETDIAVGHHTQVPESDTTGQKEETDMSEDCSQDPESDMTGQREEPESQSGHGPVATGDPLEETEQAALTAVIAQREEPDIQVTCVQENSETLTAQTEKTQQIPVTPITSQRENPDLLCEKIHEDTFTTQREEVHPRITEQKELHLQTDQVLPSREEAGQSHIGTTVVCQAENAQNLSHLIDEKRNLKQGSVCIPDQEICVEQMAVATTDPRDSAEQRSLCTVDQGECVKQVSLCSAYPRDSADQRTVYTLDKGQRVKQMSVCSTDQEVTEGESSFCTSHFTL